MAIVGKLRRIKLSNNSEGASFWDDNKDMAKLNYFISGYDEKLMQAEPNEEKRNEERDLIQRANYEVQDNTIQALKYRAQVYKNVQLVYAAEYLSDVKSADDIQNLIDKGILPKEAKIDQETFDNIIDGWYDLEPKGVKDKDDVTIDTIMSLPLSALELGENTTGVLATSFFSKNATNKQTIGMSRFDFMQSDEDIYRPYHVTYNSVDALYLGPIKDFADEVIKKVDKTSQEKLLTDDGKFTEYGEYVMQYLGTDIAKYALLKSIAGDKLQHKLMKGNDLEGKLIYNYPKLRKDTTLKALGIHASTPVEEAKELLEIMTNGARNLNDSDISIVADSINKRIKNKTLTGFKLAEAVTNQAGLGFNIRIDACKDYVDMDAVRNGEMSFDEAWDQLIDFWKKAIQELKKINPNAYIMTEFTDIASLMSAIAGESDEIVYGGNLNALNSSLKYKNVDDAITKFFIETGATTEAGYSYTFTELLKLFSADLEQGNQTSADNKMNSFYHTMKNLFETRGADYIKNLQTFADNHDKPSVIHGMALDMGLFHSKLDTYTHRGVIDEVDPQINRSSRIQTMMEMTNSDSFSELPLEVMLNIDNRDYFRTASPRAAAMSKLMRSCINEEIKDENTKKLLKEAVTDLTNGVYLEYGTTPNLQTFKYYPALSDFKTALQEILKNANIGIKDSDIDAIVRKSKEYDRVVRHAVRGNFTPEYTPEWVKNEQKQHFEYIFGSDAKENISDYSPYVMSIAVILKEAYNEHFNCQNGDCGPDMTRALQKFVNDYKISNISGNLGHLKLHEPEKDAVRKNGYAARDFRTVIEMIMKQAELKSGKKFTQEEKDDIMLKLFKSSTEPAVQKALIYANYLAALPGVPTIFIRDTLCGLGYEDKAKNQYLQNRNAVNWSDLKDGPLKEYINKVYNNFNEIMEIRSLDGMDAINTGTPYIWDVENPENKDIPGHQVHTMAMMFKDADGHAAISVFNADGIDTNSRHRYSENIKNDESNAVDSINNDNPYVPVRHKYDFDEIILPSSIALAAGTILTNVAKGDKAEYEIRLENGLYKLVHKLKNSGYKIRMNGTTAKNSVMILRTAFRGRDKLGGNSNNINRQYNLVTNPYHKVEEPVVGENLSIISK